MKLEFADSGTFSYWMQSHFAGCVHPEEKMGQLAQAAWNAAIRSAMYAAHSAPDKASIDARLRALLVD